MLVAMAITKSRRSRLTRSTNSVSRALSALAIRSAIANHKPRAALSSGTVTSSRGTHASNQRDTGWVVVP
jgi:hypothetical protein